MVSSTPVSVPRSSRFAFALALLASVVAGRRRLVSIYPDLADEFLYDDFGYDNLKHCSSLVDGYSREEHVGLVKQEFEDTADAVYFAQFATDDIEALAYVMVTLDVEWFRESVYSPDYSVKSGDLNLIETISGWVTSTETAAQDKGNYFSIEHVFEYLEGYFGENVFKDGMTNYWKCHDPSTGNRTFTALVALNITEATQLVELASDAPQGKVSAIFMPPIYKTTASLRAIMNSDEASIPGRSLQGVVVYLIPSRVRTLKTLNKLMSRLTFFFNDVVGLKIRFAEPDNMHEDVNDFFKRPAIRVRFDGDNETYPTELVRHFVQDISTIQEVVQVRPLATYFEVDNQDTQSIVTTGVADAQTPGFFSKILKGRNQIVAVMDTGIDLQSCYFADPASRVSCQKSCCTSKTSCDETLGSCTFSSTVHRKIAQYISYRDCADVPAGHGSHVAGTILGSQNAASLANGIAPEAKVAFLDGNHEGWETASGFVAPPNIESAFEKQYDSGARVFSNSWGHTTRGSSPDGCLFGAEYDGQAIDVDMFSWKHQDALMFFAAGNNGRLSNKKAACTTNVLSPAVAKNCIAVGATLNKGGGKISRNVKQLGDVADFSAVGPTLDGRTKPDVVAPGDAVRSARAGTACDSVDKSGTSQATPVLAGMALLLREYFMEGHYVYRVDEPSGALVKALIVHGALDLSQNGLYNGKPLTKYMQGWGQPGISIVVDEDPNSEKVYVAAGFVGDLKNGTACSAESISRNSCPSFITVPGGQAQVDVQTQNITMDLRATLAYHDIPGSSRCRGTCQVNNLDLRIVSPTGRIFENPSTQDNVEQVSVPVDTLRSENSAAGSSIWSIVVIGTQVTSREPWTNLGQFYALVIGTSPNFDWNSAELRSTVGVPSGGDDSGGGLGTEAIVGGVIGGIAFVAIFSFVLVRCLPRRGDTTADGGGGEDGGGMEMTAA